MAVDSNRLFVNPYTFLPWPRLGSGGLDRRAPARHDAPCPDAWHGTIECELEAVTPLLVRWPTGTVEDNMTIYTLPRKRRPDGVEVVFLPGSSLHGALRSLHEVVAGGCLRIFDEDFVPSYRDLMHTWTDRSGWRLAQVEEVDERGLPTLVRLAGLVNYTQDHKDRTGRPATRSPRSPAVFAAPECFPAAHFPDGLTTGMRLSAPQLAGPLRGGAFRPTFFTAADLAVRPDPKGDWVALLTDASARNAHEPPQHYRVALAKLTNERVPVAGKARDDYALAAADSDDYRKLNKGPDKVTYKNVPKPRLEPVEHEGPEALSRFPVYPWLYKEQVVWVRVEENDDGQRQVGEIKPSWIWRHPGRWKAGDRVPAVTACRDWTLLCPSCRLFGSVDATAKDDDERARQNAYRGHVRVLDAEATSPWANPPKELAPMGAPRPGAGQFYLAAAGQKGRMAESTPLREWGSDADCEAVGRGEPPRRLRGRKVYWRTEMADGLGRHERREQHHKPEVCAKVELMPAGSRFRVKLVFENLNREQVGALVAVLDPGRLFAIAIATATAKAGRSVADATRPARHPAGRQADHPAAGTNEFVIALGGGKPFGFGSCRAHDITVTRVDHVARYRGEDADTVLRGEDLDTLIAGFAAAARKTSPWLAEQWEHASRALRLSHVDSSIVWYPPGAPWSTWRGGTDPVPEEFDTPYEFWRRSVGRTKLTTTDADMPLVPLPPITANDQTLEIITKAPQRRGMPR